MRQEQNQNLIKPSAHNQVDSDSDSLQNIHPLPVFDLFLPCAAGVEDMLADEVHRLTGLAGKNLLVARTGVQARGDYMDMLSLNLHSRLAQRVLVRLVQFEYRSETDIYDAASKLAWEDWFLPSQTFMVEVTAQHSPLKSLNFATLTVKDAVCDRFRDARDGVRPSVARHHPHVRIYLHLTDVEAFIYIDTSGEPLFKRGWRENTGDAPLKETLAAAMLVACGWVDSAQQAQLNDEDPPPLYDPCCGSGTVVIEAAQIAANMPAGLYRSFAFEKYLMHKPHTSLWQGIREKAMKNVRKAPDHPLIFGSDVSHRMVDFALQNAKNARIEPWLELRGGDALQRMPPTPKVGVLLLNPPYGERIDVGGFSAKGRGGGMRYGRESAIIPHNNPHEDLGAAQNGVEEDFFAKLATHWKHHYAHWQAWILTPDLKIPSKMRFKESRRVPLWNGPIECRLFRFDLIPRKNRDTPTDQK